MQDVTVSEITYQPAYSAEALSLPNFLPGITVPNLAGRPKLAAEVGSTPQFLPHLEPRLKSGSYASSSDRIQDFILEIAVPAFGMKIPGEISDMRIGENYEEVVFESVVHEGVLAFLTLHNERSNGGGDDLQIRSASLSFQVTNHKARTHFVHDSLYALLGLAGPITVSVPGMKNGLGLNFRVASPEISKLLQLRQIEFGLMVIGKACGVDFDIPPHISGEEMNSISFAYHAIRMHQFEWRVNSIIQPTPAREDMVAWFQNLRSAESNGTYKLMFGPSLLTRSVFGQKISLGQQTIFIDDGVIESQDNVRSELAKRDGHIVQIRVIPRSRKGRFVFTNTPRLPEEPWDKMIETLVGLEDSLDERLAARYNEMATSTVADLTPDEIELVTARPELSEDAYLVRD
jgi:hypothetical protein